MSHWESICQVSITRTIPYRAYDLHQSHYKYYEAQSYLLHQAELRPVIRAR